MRVERTDWDGRDAAALARDLRAARQVPEDITGAVAEIVRDVERRGDAAVRELTQRLDGAAGPPGSQRVPAREIDRARAAVSPALGEAMEAAARNIRTVAEAELAAASPVEVELGEGQRVRVVESPIGAAGVYAPGGRAAYPSSVLMCCVPARVAGVERIALASPPGRDGSVDAGVLTACAMVGIDEVYAVGGAQAIAALAFGTETVTPVDLIAGPGNRYVVEAKRAVSSRVGIDGVAGPTELVLVADGSMDPRTAALDLCAQGEHGPDGLLAAISADAGFLEALASLLPELAADRPSVADVGVAAIAAPDVDAALELADRLAPEHLELQIDGAEELAAARVAGCVFVGSGGGAAFGDYAAGSNHVLPTEAAARFGRPLGPRTFLRRTAAVSVPSGAASALAPVVSELASAEGFPVHGESARARAGDNGEEAT